MLCCRFKFLNALMAAAGLTISFVHAVEPNTSLANTDQPRSRTFDFTYEATFLDLPEGKMVRIWLPMPASNEDQDAQLISGRLGASELTEEPRFHNHIYYLETKARGQEPLSLKLTYRITRREVRADKGDQPKDMDELARFLQPDAKVPIGGRPLDLLKGKEVPSDQVAAARMIYDIVNSHMQYKKVGTGWGHGDSVWACEKGYGNCTDFHSLFISLARSQKIPARFEIGFPIPVKRGIGEIPGYHCWAKFRPAGRGWIPVDISEANKNPKMSNYYFGNLTEDRVAFSTGRDIDLVPRQSGKPLNFFIYPHAEVDGTLYPETKIKKHFRYKDAAETNSK